LAFVPKIENGEKLVLEITEAVKGQSDFRSFYLNLQGR